MVFSSFPSLYLDHTNLNQINNQSEYHQHEQGAAGLESQQFATVVQPPHPAAAVRLGVGGAGSIRPGSMVDRARMAKIPLPEPGLKCPRCNSTNTKFCYFNNYSLTQPRHLTCRRYWTRGGALRNVPVGGGCRRNNKRTTKSGNNNKNNNSGSGSNPGPEKQTESVGASAPASACEGQAEIGGHFSQIPLMAGAFQNLINPHHYGGFPPPPLQASGGGGIGEMGFQIPPSCLGVGGGGGDDLYSSFPMSSERVEESSSSVKMEENGQGLNGNSTKQFLGSLENNPYWGWTGFSGLNNSSSSTTHLL